uniref:Uncharacterized protein n=1 Tax=Anopheles arabiensis TaxID=7173 RepID=A0A182IBX3_ANOAR
MCSYAVQNQRDNMCWCFEEISLMLLVQRILMYLWYRLLLKMFPRLSVLPNCHDNHMPPTEPICGAIDAMFEHQQQDEDDEPEEFNFNCSDISHIYQSTFLDDEYDECLLAKDIAWDAPVPEVKAKAALPLEQEISLLLNDYYIDDDLDDHLQMAEYQTAIGSSMLCCDSFLE